MNSYAGDVLRVDKFALSLTCAGVDAKAHASLFSAQMQQFELNKSHKPFKTHRFLAPEQIAHRQIRFYYSPVLIIDPVNEFGLGLMSHEIPIGGPILQINSGG